VRVRGRAMSKWLALARSQAPVPNVPKSPKSEPSGQFGDFDHFGTGDGVLPERPDPSHFGDFGNFGTALAISAEEIRASFDWIAHRLEADHARPRDVAQSDALAILRGMISNDPRLIVPQPNAWRCVICGEGGSPGLPLVPVLTPNEGEYRWLHHGCHDTYCCRQAERVDELLRAAGVLCQ
jgi:hypothetical protein